MDYLQTKMTGNRTFMSSTITQKQRSTWRNLICGIGGCPNVLGLTDTIAIIIGGCLIEQPRTTILCTKCSRNKIVRSQTENKRIRFVTEETVVRLEKGEIQVKDLFFSAK